MAAERRDIICISLQGSPSCEAPASTRCLFFLDIGRGLRPSEISIQFHMVSYCSTIKLQFTYVSLALVRSTRVLFCSSNSTTFSATMRPHSNLHLLFPLFCLYRVKRIRSLNVKVPVNDQIRYSLTGTGEDLIKIKKKR